MDESFNPFLNSDDPMLGATPMNYAYDSATPINNEYGNTTPTKPDKDSFGMASFNPSSPFNPTHCSPLGCPAVSTNNNGQGTTPVTVQYVLPNLPNAVTFSAKIVKKFSGYMHEDANKFLNEFESYLVLSNISSDSGRAVAAFHLHLQGPALTWFQNIPDKSSWQVVKQAFLAEYCDLTKLNNDPRYISESAAFDHLSLNPTQPIEEFHSVIFDKGNLLGKSERDLIFKFIQGLPHQLAFFVRAGQVSSFREALHSAKIGEAHGYRSHTTTYNVGSVTPQPVKPPRTNHQPWDRSGGNKRTCFLCQGQGHIKSACNWTGVGSITQAKCQLCFQSGHIAVNCKTLVSSNETCQLCNTSGHTARKCERRAQSSPLNKQRLEAPPISQANNQN